VIRELVDSAIFRLRSLGRIPALCWQIWPRRFGITTTRNSDALLQNAALLSLSLHLVALLLLPTPGASGETASPMRVVIRNTLVPPEVVAIPDPAPEVPVPVEPEVVEVPRPESVPDEPEPGAQPEPIFLQEKFDSDLNPASPEPLDVPPESSLDREKVTALLEQARKSALKDQARQRWLMLEVREKILNNLSHLLQGGTTIHQGNENACFLLGFRIDAEGWIYDLSLRPAPGVQLDAFAVRDAIASLNPLVAPPAGGTLPVELHLRVDLLDQRR